MTRRRRPAGAPPGPVGRTRCAARGARVVDADVPSGGPRREDGQATVELALALPAVLLALLAIVQAGLVVADHVRTVHVAREAARAVAVDGRPGAASAAATDAGGEGCMAASDRPAEVGATLVVTVTCPSPTRVPLVGALVPDVEVRAEARMRVER